MSNSVAKKTLDRISFACGDEFYHKSNCKKELYRLNIPRDKEANLRIEKKMPNGEWQKIYWVDKINDTSVDVSCTVGDLSMEGVIQFRNFIQA